MYSGISRVSFTTSTSSRDAPEITSKQFVSPSIFTVNYTSSSVTSGPATISSTVYVLNPDNLIAAESLGPNDGSVNLINYYGANVDLYISDEFTSVYSVGTDTGLISTQTINSDPVNFNVAYNPSINQASIVANAATNTVTFSVNNNGSPNLNTAMIVLAQDSSQNENDPGMYSLNLFTNAAGFALNLTETSELTNEMGGVNGNTLTVTAIQNVPVTGLVTYFSLSSQTAFMANTPMNLVFYVANSVEGSDSCAVANQLVV